MKLSRNWSVCLLFLTTAGYAVCAGTVFDAAKTGDASAVSKYIERLGVDINIIDADKRTPLSYACELEDLATARYLLDRGANQNIADKLGWTPIVYAVSRCNGDMVGLLLSKKADITIQIGNVNPGIKSRLTLFEFALYTAVVGGGDVFQSVDIVRQLRDAFAAQRIAIDPVKTAIDVKMLSKYPLLREMILGTINSVKKVVQSGAAVDTTDPISPVTTAVLLDLPEVFSYFQSAGFVEKPFSEVVSVALRTGFGYAVLDSIWPSVSPEDIATYMGEQDRSLYADILASAYSQVFIKYLFKMHFDFTWNDSDGKTLMSSVAFYGRFDMAEDLLSHGLVPDLNTIELINALSQKGWDDPKSRENYIGFLRLLKSKQIAVNNPDGLISTVAGGRQPGYVGDGGLAIAAKLDHPHGVVTDTAGNLYIADTDNNVIRKVGTNGMITTVAGQLITTEAGPWRADYAGDGGPATAAKLDHPYGVVTDTAGNLYIADTGNCCIRKIDLEGIITTVAGQAPKYEGDSGGYSGDGGPATLSKLKRPNSVAADNVGALYIADTENNRIRKVDVGGIITTVAGNGQEGYAGDGGPATAAKLGAPSGIAVDIAGNLYIADTDNSCIRKVDVGGIITTVAGNDKEGYAGDGGPAIAATLGAPSGIAVDTAGNLYIADTDNNRIRKVDVGGIITTVAGGSIENGDGGPAILGSATSADAVTINQAGNIYFSDGESRVRWVQYSQLP